jgi:2-keto-4-pentenoate hydratase/2-oxohepta-3-ene-1,7-dioic acid hydratase in catechol pathway
MRLAKVVLNGRCAEAVIQGEDAIIVGPWLDDSAERALFELPMRVVSDWRAIGEANSERVALADLRLAAPVDPRSKILCVGANYRDHATEIGQGAKTEPQIFLRQADSLVGHGEPLVRPRVSEQFDFEGELAVVIGRGGRHITVGEAPSHVLGYTCFMDGSVRDYQRHAVTAGKNFWRSGSMGPWIVTVDEVPSIGSAKLRTVLNGAEMQASSVAEMIHNTAELIAYCSRWTPLAPGDVIATGTPAGIGSRRSPPIWMRDGDVLEVRIDGVGHLVNQVTEESPIG